MKSPKLQSNYWNCRNLRSYRKGDYRNFTSLDILTRARKEKGPNPAKLLELARNWPNLFN